LWKEILCLVGLGEAGWPQGLPDAGLLLACSHEP
jgi:hypothetical protein